MQRRTSDAATRHKPRSPDRSGSLVLRGSYNSPQTQDDASTYVSLHKLNRHFVEPEVVLTGRGDIDHDLSVRRWAHEDRDVGRAVSVGLGLHWSRSDLRADLNRSAAHRDREDHQMSLVD